MGADTSAGPATLKLHEHMVQVRISHEANHNVPMVDENGTLDQRMSLVLPSGAWRGW